MIAGLVGAAVGTELAKPSEQRTWHGTVAGVLPYDLRPPTPDRIRSGLLESDSESLIIPHVFGVGWTLNVGRILRLVGVQLPGSRATALE